MAYAFYILWREIKKPANYKKMVELKKQNIKVSGLQVVRRQNASINLSGDFCEEMVISFNDLCEYLTQKEFNKSGEYTKAKGTEKQKLITSFKAYLSKNKTFTENFVCGYAKAGEVTAENNLLLKGGVFNCFVVQKAENL